MAEREARLIQVAGDITVDWMRRSARQVATSGSDGGSPRIGLSAQHGGAALLGGLIAHLADDLNCDLASDLNVEVHDSRDAHPAELADPSSTAFHRTFSTWERFPLSLEHPEDSALRMSSFEGVEHAPWRGPEHDDAELGFDPSELTVLALADLNLGFRDRATPPRAISEPTSDRYPWVLLRMAAPVASGPLFDHLRRRPDRLIVVVTIDDLRRSGVTVSGHSSWERAAEDLVSAFATNPNINALSGCAFVVVSFGTSGALVIQQGDETGEDDPPFQSRLFFDPHGLEGDWARRSPGSMLGCTSCVVAAMARELLLHPDDPYLDRGVERGLSATRALHFHGYEEYEYEEVDGRFRFPFGLITRELQQDSDRPTTLPSRPRRSATRHRLDIGASVTPTGRRRGGPPVAVSLSGWIGPPCPPCHEGRGGDHAVLVVGLDSPPATRARCLSVYRGRTRRR